MKTYQAIILGAVLSSLVAGRAVAATTLPPVGPNPLGSQSPSASGQLEVFSQLEGHSEGNNPPWYQHADYYICDRQGNKLQQVDNTVGYYARTPRLVTLPSGEYVIKSPAKDAFWVKIPVVIRAGYVTKVHLDGNWAVPASTPEAKVVLSPSGYPVGWRVANGQ